MINCECQKFFYNPSLLRGLGLVCAVCGRELIKPKKTQLETVQDKLRKEIEFILLQELTGEDNEPSNVSHIANIILARLGRETDLLENQIRYLEDQLDLYSSPLDKK